MQVERIAALMTRGATLLVVDDDESTLEALRALLRPFSGSVYFAANGEDGCALGCSLKPTVVLTDIRMPGMDGLEMARRIKQVSPGTRVIFASAYNAELDRLDDYQAFASLHKPINLGHMYSLIEQAMTSWSHGRQDNGLVAV